MLLKEEFASNMGYLEPSINSMMIAAEGRSLSIFFFMVLTNFLYWQT